MLLSPNSKYGTKRAPQFGDSIKSLQEGIKLSINEITELSQETKYKIKCNLYDELPLWRLFIFENTIFVGTFLENADGRKAPHFKLTSDHCSPLFLGFNSYFDYMWNEKSLTLDEHTIEEARNSNYVNALEFLTESGCSEEVVRHSTIVADIASKIANNAKDDYPRLNLSAIELVALLHDS